LYLRPDPHGQGWLRPRSAFGGTSGRASAVRRFLATTWVHPPQVPVRGPDIAAAGGVLYSVEQGCLEIWPRRYGIMNEFFRSGGVSAALGGACGEQHDRRLFAAGSRGGGECGERLREVGTLGGAALDLVREIAGHGLRRGQVAERLHGPLAGALEEQAERLRAGYDIGAVEAVYPSQVPGRTPDRHRPAEGLQAARPQYLADWRQRRREEGGVLPQQAEEDVGQRSERMIGRPPAVTFERVGCRVRAGGPQPIGVARVGLRCLADVEDPVGEPYHEHV
jgi:hypothetical protein